MSKVHPTALVDDGVELGPDVEVGPYAIVEAGARLGARCVVEAHAIVKGGTIMGDEGRVGHFAVVGGDPQYLAFDPATPTGVLLGDRVRLGEGVTIHRSIHEGKNTLIGSDVFLMGYSHVGHDCVLSDYVVVANAALLAGHVELGAHAFVGGGAAFHQFARVGEGAMIGGAAEVSADVPPFVTVARRNLACGLNLVGLKRRETPEEVTSDLKACYRAVYLRQGKPRSLAEKALTEEGLGVTEQGLAFLEFFLKGERGFARSRRQTDDS